MPANPPADATKAPIGAMFAVVGEALIDLVQPAPGDTYRALPAGGPLNIAVALRRLGHPTAMMARFSSGALGARLLEHAEASGLDLSASVRTDAQPTLAFATVDARGRAAYDFYVDGTADWGWTEEELAAVPRGTRCVHTGSLATALEPGAGRIADRWAELSEAGDVVLSFDPNIRPTLAGRREDAVRRVERLVCLSHVVKASDEDLGWLYPELGAEEALRRWAGFGPAVAVVTRGPQGCLGIVHGSAAVEVPAPRVAVVDTIGAGDAFQAGLLSGLADLGAMETPGALRELPPKRVGDALRRAVTVAALTCGRAGADPPSRAEYDAASLGVETTSAGSDADASVVSP